MTQRIITARTVPELTATLNDLFEDGYRIVPGTIGLTTCEIAATPFTPQIERTPEGTTFRVVAWAVVEKDKDTERPVMPFAEAVKPH